MPELSEEPGLGHNQPPEEFGEVDAEIALTADVADGATLAAAAKAVFGALRERRRQLEGATQRAVKALPTRDVEGYEEKMVTLLLQWRALEVASGEIRNRLGNGWRAVPKALTDAHNEVVSLPPELRRVEEAVAAALAETEERKLRVAGGTAYLRRRRNLRWTEGVGDVRDLDINWRKVLDQVRTETILSAVKGCLDFGIEIGDAAWLEDDHHLVVITSPNNK